jgi:hypothetical protein
MDAPVLGMIVNGANDPDQYAYGKSTSSPPAPREPNATPRSPS